jgi:hypothetical protein
MLRTAALAAQVALVSPPPLHGACTGLKREPLTLAEYPEVVMRRWSLVALIPLMVVVAGFIRTHDRGDRLLATELQRWNDVRAREASITQLQALNPEWDLMRRTFLALTLADDAIAHPEREAVDLAAIDDLLASIVQDEAEQGQAHFLLDYGKHGGWRDPAGRSVFVDGEIALVAGARRLVADDPAMAAVHRERAAFVTAALDRSPTAESYPDEGWLFCVTNALVALKMLDQLDGTDHRATIHTTLAGLPREPATGLLASSFTWDGVAKDGPEGSSIWLAVANLAVVDPALAADQYARAKAGLLHGALGLDWASEWGPGWKGPVDVDSGPPVPWIDASASSSGFAIVAAAAMQDRATLAALKRSLLAADAVMLVYPVLAEAADNPMGNVIVAHGTTFGGVWGRLTQPAG